MLKILSVVLLSLISASVYATDGPVKSFISDPIALVAAGIFLVAYAFVMVEEFTEMRKSKPVLLAAGLIWVLVAVLANMRGVSNDVLHAAVAHNLVEYAELLLFLLVAMTYINALSERNVFEVLRCWLVSKRLSYRQLFWITGVITFFLSPIADNLTAALLMGTVILSAANGHPKFIAMAFVNVVIAANAGGVFSPFGDITTLMVWQASKVAFTEFFQLFVPSVVNYLIPAFCISFFLPNDTLPEHSETVTLKRGARRLCVLFLMTIACAVLFKQMLHLPPFMGMMMGLSFLFIFSYYLKMTGKTKDVDRVEYNVFNRVEQAEWDTLCFFFGVVFCVGGLSFLGYLEWMSHLTYDGWGATVANIFAGVLSAIVDNIPVMFAILTMDPEMDLFQWLLVTLTAGVGGSMLSVGSAAGIALMGHSKGQYTFFSHLKWMPVIALGYVAAIGCHFWLN